MSADPVATFALLRSPLLPVDEWIAWSDGADRAQLVERLRGLAQRDEVREALCVASPSFDAAIDAWLSGLPTATPSKVERGLVRYLARMCMRSTPFGLFAGCSLMRIGATTRLSLAPRTAYRRRTRLNTALLLNAPRGPHNHEQELVANATVYWLSGELRYLRVDRQRTPWSVHLSAVEPTPHLAFVLRRARSGISRTGLLRSLCEQEAVDEQEAAEFVDTLLERQLLEPNLPLGLYGDDPLSTMTTVGAPEESRRLAHAAALLCDLDARPVGSGLAQCRQLVQSVPSNKADGATLNGDLYKPGDLVLGHDVAAELARGARLLARIGDGGANPALEAFRAAFRARYEGAGVPLLQALDEDAGIGFDSSEAPGVEPSPLPAMLDLPRREDRSVVWRARDAYLLRRIEALARAGQRELRISDEDLTALGCHAPPELPETFGVAGKLLATSASAVCTGDYRVLLTGVIAGSPLGYVARYADLDAELLDAARAHARAEQALRPDVILADVVHVPDGRIGNIVLRPRVRDAYISVVDRASARVDGRELVLSDLMVSVERDRVVLRLPSGEEVEPRVSTAHETRSRRSVGIYRFLCALARQGRLPAGRWDWGPLAQASFLPRVVSGRIVLASARWRVDGSRIAALAGDDVTLLRAAAELRAELGLPRRVLMADDDRALLVDFDNVLTVESFAQLARGLDSVVLVEMLPELDEQCVHGAEGRFAHELIVAFANQARAKAAPALAVPEAARPVFTPASDWLFVKLFVGSARADDVLLTKIRALVGDAQRAGMIDAWFFVRYAAPTFQLRIRFHGVPARLREELLPRVWELGDDLVRSGCASRVQFDNYVREVQRYGGAEAMAAAEQIFFADSEAALAIIGACDGADESRWRAAVLGCHLFARDLGLSVERSAALFRRVADAFKRELHLDVRATQRLGRAFRSSRADLERLIGGASEDPVASQIRGALEERSVTIRDTVTRLHALAAQSALTVSVDEIAEALMHMHVNRLVPSSARAHELAIYDFLARLHESRLVRSR
jgi:thiopeptide-type bacteriocin biosynthesis protein